MTTTIDILTCTNGRPLCLELCKGYVAAQTHPIRRHIVADGKPIWGNMIDGLQQVEADAVVIFEDDDFYPPDWVETCAVHLTERDLVGQMKAYMYHLPAARYGMKWPSNHGSSLHSTAMRRELIPSFIEMIRELEAEADPFLDYQLWASSQARKRLLNVRKVISMKGMPGTAGYSIKHEAGRLPMRDDDRSILRSWVGETAKARYLEIAHVAQ